MTRPGHGFRPANVVAQLRRRAADTGLSVSKHAEEYRGAIVDVMCTTHLDATFVAVFVLCPRRGTYMHNRHGWTVEEAAAEGRRIVDQWGDL